MPDDDLSFILMKTLYMIQVYNYILRNLVIK